MTAPPTELHALTAAELSAGYAAGRFTPPEVLQAVQAHIARWEPHVQALWHYDAERDARQALAAAHASQARWRAGTPLSPLDGVPGTLKENIATAGTPLPLGSAATEPVPAAADAPPAARWREAGLVLLGKTTMPDYGMLSSGLSSFHQARGALTRNPWNLALNPGGSSAGAGAAAAAGYGPLHVGTDIGGSIRLPATWCGIVGFKPSNGRIPIQPPYLGRVAGPMARTVTDCALLMAPLSRPDDRDATRLPFAELPWHEVATTPPEHLRGLRVGLWMDAGFGLPLEPTVRAAVLDAARRVEAAGAVVEPMAAFATPAMIEGIDRFWRMRSWLDIEALPPERRARVLPFIREWVAPGAHTSAAALFAGYGQFAALRDAAVAACHRFDLVVSPVCPVAGFPAEWAMPSNDPARAMAHIGFTVPFNMSEQPAISVPCAVAADGRPIGLQIVGRRHDDLGVLRAACAFEQLRAPLPPWPEPPR